MNSKIFTKFALLTLFTICNLSCEDFVEVDAPNNKLVREQVFNSDETVISAMTGIYNELFQAAFSNGSRNSVTVLSALSADNLENINTTNLFKMEFQENELSPDNSNNLDIWSSAYNMIYMTNSFLEGLANSSNISSELETQLEGEARFVRAFTYFYLVNLYGDIPLILSTNYQENELAVRTPEDEIYDQIIGDLILATELLTSEYREGERTKVNSYTATALLARLYLYLGNWSMAESLSTEVINANSTYEILDDIDNVFLANSKEAIWQISPIGGTGIVFHTNEGNLFNIDPFFSFFASLKLNEDFVTSFEDNDLRSFFWIDYNASKDVFFPNKYNIMYSDQFPIEEYSMVLRLAEQYLIRAEARVRQDMLDGAIEDLDIIKKRAGLDLISEINPAISKDDLLDEIMKERRKELFTEWGHRWFDLKRTNMAEEVLGENNSLWDSTDVLYPIPSEERKRNPNLTQNPGY